MLAAHEAAVERLAVMILQSVSRGGSDAGCEKCFALGPRNSVGRMLGNNEEGTARAFVTPRASRGEGVVENGFNFGEVCADRADQ